MATTSANIAVNTAGIIAGMPWDGKDKEYTLHQRVTATVAKPLVTSTVYRVLNVPAGVLCTRVAYKVVTKDASSGVLTVQATSPKGSTKMITSGTLYTTAGYYAYVSSGSLAPKFFEAAGTIDIVPHTVSPTTLVIDVFAKFLDLSVNTTQDTDTVYAS
jgi:hypothetical protein